MTEEQGALLDRVAPISRSGEYGIARLHSVTCAVPLYRYFRVTAYSTVTTAFTSFATVLVS